MSYGSLNSKSSSPPRHVPTLPAGGFLSEESVAEWLRAGTAVQNGPRLQFGGNTFAISEAVRVLGRRDSESDPYGLTGSVLTLRQLVRKGAVLSADGFKLGAGMYDIEFGVVAEPA